MRNFFKNHRILSICIISAVVIIAAVAIIISASSSKKPEQVQSGQKLLLSYLTQDEDGKQIHLALSDEGLNFKPLNNGNSVVTQTEGNGSIENPFIISDAIGIYHIIGADVSNDEAITSNHSLISWTSEDLVTWKDEVSIDLRVLAGFENCTSALSPRAIWDKDENKFMIYFSAVPQHGDENNPSLYYSYTTDFIHLSAPKPLFPEDAQSDFAIDCSAIVFDEAENKYKLYFKNEDEKISVAESKSLTEGYENISDVKELPKCSSFSVLTSENGSTQIFCFKKGDVDAFELDESGKFKRISSNLLSFPESIISGSIAEISDSEYEKLLSAYGFAQSGSTRLITPFSTTAEAS